MSTSTGRTRSRRRVNALARLLAVLALLTAALWLFDRSPAGAAVLEAEKRVVEALSGAAGVRTIDVGAASFIAYAPGDAALTIYVTPSCSGVYAASFFAVASAAVPVPPRQKLVALAAYTPAVYLLNLARMALSVVAGVRLGVRAFEIVHGVVGSAAFIVAYVILWLDWLSRSAGPMLPRGSYYKG